jgi:hypothetical protein
MKRTAASRSPSASNATRKLDWTSPNNFAGPGELKSPAPDTVLDTGRFASQNATFSYSAAPSAPPEVTFAPHEREQCLVIGEHAFDRSGLESVCEVAEVQECGHELPGHDKWATARAALVRGTAALLP